MEVVDCGQDRVGCPFDGTRTCGILIPGARRCPQVRTGVHHRDDSGAIATRILHQGSLRLDPPGLTVMVADLFPGAAS